MGSENMKLLLGTHNVGKAPEYRKFLQHADLEIVTLKDIGFLDDAPETGETFFEVCLEKAKWYAQRTEYPVLADDGGFEIDALDGEPGVNSRRWVGPSGTDDDRIQKVFDLLRGVPAGERTARLKLVLIVYFPHERDYISVEKTIEGIIPDESGDFIIKDFPYRSVLFLPQFRKYYGELTEAEHDEVNHRKAACKELLIKLEPYLNS